VRSDAIANALRKPNFAEAIKDYLVSDDRKPGDLERRCGDASQEKGDAQRGHVLTRRLSEIEAKPISWLWPGRIARGKVTLIAGNPGLGKSQVTASIAGIVTTGGTWPVDRTRCDPGGVLFFSAEDDPADTLRPRLEAVGADLGRVHFVDGIVAGFTGDGMRHQRAFSLQSDLEALEAKLAELEDVSVVVIDPITAYLGDTDSHKNAEVRGLLAPLSELAARYNAAIIAVSHLNKNMGMQAMMRVSGSLGFVAMARGAYLVTEDRQDRERRLFLPLKNNIGPDVTGFAFRIESATAQSTAGPLETSRVVWESGTVSASADEALGTLSKKPKQPVLEEAQTWLKDQLSKETVAAAEIFDRGRGERFSTATLRRAAKELQVEKAKTGMEGGWVWSLPKVINGAEGAQPENVSTFEEFDHLRDSAQTELEI
jgi:putative DNA primase/helicase